MSGCSPKRWIAWAVGKPGVGLDVGFWWVLAKIEDPKF